MAQVFVPENPREREQLQGGIGVSDRLERPHIGAPRWLWFRC